jgi:hypothetical protein
VKRHQIDRRNGAAGGIVAGRQLLTDDTFLSHERIQAGTDQLLIDLQDLRRLADQLRLGEIAVPVLSGLGEGELRPALIRSGDSCGIPTAWAIVSAVLKPIPHTSEASR